MDPTKMPKPLSPGLFIGSKNPLAIIKRTTSLACTRNKFDKKFRKIWSEGKKFPRPSTRLRRSLVEG